MKNQLFCLLFLLTSPLLYGQSTNWKQINTPYKGTVLLQYQASDGTLFGYLTEPFDAYQIVSSIDNGQTWKIALEFSENIRSFNGKIPFVEDNLGRVYFNFRSSIFSYNKSTQFFEFFISTESNAFIGDLDFLDNGDMIVGTGNNLMLYSNTGVLKKKHEWMINSVEFFVSENAIGKSYVKYSLGASNYLLEFTNDLNFVGNDVLIGGIQSLVRLGDRLIRNNEYSNDGGKSWQAIEGLQMKYINYVNKGHDNTVYFVTNSDVFVSNDGLSAVKKNVGVQNVNYISSINNNVLAIGSLEDYCAPGIYISTDAGVSVQKIKNDIGEYFTEVIRPGVEENLFINDCQFKHKSSNSESWNNVQNDPWVVDVFCLSNNDVLFYDYLGLHKSTDEGQTWALIITNWYEPFSFTEKRDALYYLEYNSIGFSKDYGTTWQKLNIPSQISFYKDKIDFSQSGEIYYYHFAYDGSSLEKYNPETESGIRLELPTQDDQIFDIITSFEGGILYVLLIDQGEIKLLSSVDEGLTFVINSLANYTNSNENYQIKTDHLGNVYVYSEKKVLMSSDNGGTWQDISPNFPELRSINDLAISFDNYIYLATNGKGILKYNVQLAEPKILKVALYQDDNENCQKETTEQSLKSGKIVVNENYIKPVDASGKAIFYLTQDENTVSVQVNDKIFGKCQASYNVNLSNITDVFEIPLKTQRYCADVVTTIGTPLLRRCFENTYYGQVCNEGNIEAKETKVSIILDEFFELVDVNLPILSHTGNELILDAGTLQEGECKTINMRVLVSCDASLGQEHCVYINSETKSEDCNAQQPREAYGECQENIGSYDPNDKAIFVNGTKDKAYLEIGDELEYLIRFQNTGTDTAFTVKIQDPISYKFDISSIQPVAASHPYEWLIRNGILLVEFNNINLVDSFKNEPASHGFIKFKIALASETMINQQVNNVAGIYFDYNEPVLTNEVITPVGKPLATNEPNNDATVFLYPNPTNDVFTIASNNGIKLNGGEVNIFDQKGQKLLTTTYQFNNKIHVGSLPAGFYIVQIISNGNEYKTKLIKM